MSKDARALLSRKMMTADLRNQNQRMSRLLNDTVIRDIEARELTSIADDLGEVRGYRILTGTGEPTDGTYSGTFIDADGLDFLIGIFHIGGVKNGILKWGGNSDTGDFMFAGGAARINDLGITTEGINYFYRFNVQNGATMRRLEFLTTLTAGVLAGCMAWYDPSAGSNLQTNPGFEAGDLSSWSAADSGAPAWSADTGSPQAGSYAAKLNTTGDNESNLQTNGDLETGDFTGWATAGTGTWSVQSSVKDAGTYAALLSATASQTGSLTTNLGGTPRIGVVAGLEYDLYYSGALGGTPTSNSLATFEVLIKWYTATSGGSLISTSTFSFAGGGAPSFFDAHETATAPATAQGAEIVFNFVRTANAGTRLIYIDTVSFLGPQYGTLTTNLGGTPRMAVTAGNSYGLSLYGKTDNGLTTWATLNAYVKWYTATSGGSLISTDTVPLTLTTSYANFARTLTAPAGAAGAEIVIEAIRGTSGQGSTNLYFDAIIFQAVTINNGVKYTDAGPTIFGAPLNFEERAAPDTPASGIQALYASSVDHAPHRINSFGQDDMFLTGESGAAVSFAGSNGVNTIVSKTIKANAAGTKGFVITRVFITHLSNSSTEADRTFDVVYNFGAYNITRQFTPANAATARSVYILEFITFFDQAANAQRHMGLSFATANVVANTWTTIASPQIFEGSSAIDNASDIVISVTGKMGGANANVSFKAVGAIEGPYYE